MRVESYRFRKGTPRNYIRTICRRLTFAQKERIKQAYLAHEQPKLVAIELGCSVRIVRQYYQQHRGYGMKPHEYRPRPGRHNPKRDDPPPPPPKPKKPLVNEARFYHSDFVPR